MDGFEHALHVRQHVVVPKAQHAIACGFQPACARLITFSDRSFGMLRAIDFDHDTRAIVTREIDNVATKTNLAAKMRAEHG